jgi:hypothetical protein
VRSGGNNSASALGSITAVLTGGAAIVQGTQFPPPPPAGLAQLRCLPSEHELPFACCTVTHDFNESKGFVVQAQVGQVPVHLSPHVDVSMSPRGPSTNVAMGAELACELERMTIAVRQSDARIVVSTFMIGEFEDVSHLTSRIGEHHRP